MKKDATEGVSEEQTTETIDEEKRPGTGHADELENIVVAREEQFEEDSGVKLDRGEEEEKSTEGAETDTETEEDTEKTDKKGDKKEDDEELKAIKEAADESLAVEIVVNGEKKTVPLSEVKDAGIRSLQKESAADKRLEEATKLLKEAKEVHTEQPPDKDVEAEKTEETDSSKKDAEDELATSREAYRNAIQYGTDEEVDEALIKYEKAQRTAFLADSGASGDATQPVTVDDVADKLEERKVIKQFSLPKDEGGFKDLTDDPVLRHAAEVQVDELLKDGEPNTWDTYQKAGELVREKYVIGSQPSEKDAETEEKPTSDESMETKKERKREIDNIPAANARTESTLEPEKQESPKEIVEKMRLSRPGQPI
jgi:hypothetical protein